MVSVAELRRKPFDESLCYYAFTLTADDEGQINTIICSSFCGWNEDWPRVEMREGRILNSGYADNWTAIGQDFIFVTEEKHLLIYMRLGGNALIERSIAEKYLPQEIMPRPVFRLGEAGFADAGQLDKGAFKRAPNPKLRMKIFDRDRRRCRICGRSPDNYGDVELHIHHIRPWGEAGLTDPTNLITLCHTCHKGLQPHFDVSLFRHLDLHLKYGEDIQFDRAVANYRKAAAFNIRRLASDDKV